MAPWHAQPQRSRLTLSEDRLDDDGLPLARIDVRYDGAALGVLDAAAERFQAVFADADNPMRIIPDDWAPRPGSSVHYAGSVRMHADAEHGVLDEWNRVHSCPNVLVVDMACFTTNPEKNPTLTAMALAARAADHLAASW